MGDTTMYSCPGITSGDIFHRFIDVDVQMSTTHIGQSKGNRNGNRNEKG